MLSPIPPAPLHYDGLTPPEFGVAFHDAKSRHHSAADQGGSIGTCAVNYLVYRFSHTTACGLQVVTQPALCVLPLQWYFGGLLLKPPPGF